MVGEWMFDGASTNKEWSTTKAWLAAVRRNFIFRFTSSRSFWVPNYWKMQEQNKAPEQTKTCVPETEPQTGGCSVESAISHVRALDLIRGPSFYGCSLPGVCMVALTLAAGGTCPVSNEHTLEYHHFQQSQFCLPRIAQTWRKIEDLNPKP